VPRRYRFGEVEIDLLNFRVLKAGKVVPLEPKAMSVLAFLVEHRGRLVEKRELLDAVWNDTFVTENVLTRAIAQLRKALADDAKDSRYIETVPTRGYRFIADVTEEVDGVGDPLAAAMSPSDAQPVANTTQVAERAATSRRRRFWLAAAAVATLVFFAAVAFLVVRRHGDSEFLQIAASTQITTTNGLAFYPTFSPDNTQIAYSTDRGKGFEIFVRQIASGGKEFQLTSDGNQNMQPAWSPDGNLIAYYSRTLGGIWIMPVLGGTPRKLTEFGSHPAWSRDGQWIAFQSSGLDELGSDSAGVNPPSVIWVIQPDGSNQRQITSPGQPNGGHGSPSWSPDSKHIVFISTFHGPSDLWTIGSDGKGLVHLAERASGYYDPVYAPDGMSVLYGAAASTMNFGLWQLRVDPGTSAPLGQPAQIISSGGSRIKNLAFSSNGKKLLYAYVGLAGSLQSLPMDSTFTAAGEPVTLISDAGCRDILPMFSPDGSRIAFISCHGRSGVRQQLWLMNADGSNLQQLTASPEYYVNPAWYADGHRILVESGGKLVAVNADTRQQTTVMKLNRPYTGFQFSPDGKRVAITFLDDGIQNVWILDLASGSQKQFTFDKEAAGYPAWSQDGKFIAYQVSRGPDNSIFVESSAGGAATQITPFKGQHWSYSWSPDGDKIVFAKIGIDLVWNIWSVSRSTRLEKRLTHYTKTNAFVRYPTTSPRGNQIVYEQTETTGNIWMLDLK
jgi:Tol biopolymer transport system component/DNA-binding winged helix-turn-helix (wHTH) protein